MWRGMAVIERVAAEPLSESFFLGLRLREGIAEWRVSRTWSRRFVQDGLLERAGERVRLTSRGVLLSNEVFAEFIQPAG